MTELSIVIVKYGQQKIFESCLKSIPKRPDWQTIVIDNSRNNRGYAKACNLGAKQAKGKYLLFINPDTLLSEKAISYCLTQIRKNKNIGIISPQLVDENGEAYLSYTRQPTRFSAFIVYSFFDRLFPRNPWSQAYWYRGMTLNKRRRVESISGACMFMLKRDFDALHGFDEQFFMYWEDADLCRRLLSLGKEIIYDPKVKIYHQRGGSTPLSLQIENKFKDSRYKYFKKHFGLFYALLLDVWLSVGEEWRLLTILIIATWLRFDQITTLSPLIFDQARDYLAAWSSLETKSLPLLGIASSIPRFHQGPLFIWLLMGVFVLFGVSAQVAAVMGAVIGLLAVVGVYYLARIRWGLLPAVIASLIVATSPLVVGQARMAFMINPIPLASVFFLWVLTSRYRNWKNIFLTSFFFGILLQFELAHAPLIGLTGLYLWKNRQFIRFKTTTVLVFLGGLLLSLLPQVVFDLTHQFQQLFMFGIWLVYRILRGLHLFPGSEGNFGTPWQAWSRIKEYGIKFSGWEWFVPFYIYLVVLIGGLIAYIKNKVKDETVSYCLLWLGLLLIAYTLHGNPSEAYFSSWLVPVALLVGWSANQWGRLWQKVIFILIIVIAFVNTFYLISNDYLLLTPKTASTGYTQGYGLSLSGMQSIINYVKSETHGQPITLKALGPGSEFPSFLDNYVFMLKTQGFKLVESGGKPVWITTDPTLEVAVPYPTKKVELYGVTIITENR